jgi:hypothetical protein
VPVFGVETVTVEVSPSGAVGTVTLEVDETVVGSAVIDSGLAVIPWDTTDRADGDYELNVAAFDGGGAEVASDSVIVEVANGLDDLVRIMADFDRGLLTVDEFAVLSTEAVYVPNRLPDRYLAGVDDDPEGEGTVAMLTIEELADQLSEETDEVLAAYEEVADLFLLTLLRADPDLDPRDLLAGLD